MPANILDTLVRLGGALLILIVGWLVARLIAAIIRGGLKRVNLDNRLSNILKDKDGNQLFSVEEITSRVIFYLLMIFVLVAFFQVLGLDLVTQPLNQMLNQLFLYAPRLGGALLLVLIAWLVATILRMLISRLLAVTRLDQRLSDQMGAEGQPQVPLSRTISEAIYWLVFLLFLPAILGTLGLTGLLQPVQSLLDNVMGFLPNLVAAAIIFLVGWFVARIVQRIVTNLLAATGVDRLSERVGFATVLGKQRLSGLIGLIIYILILVPVLIGSLNALRLDAITLPASNMLNTILGVLPAIFGAFLLLVLFYIIGRIVSRLVVNLLAGIGFNTLPERLGLGQTQAQGQATLSDVVGYIVLAAIMLLALIEGSQVLGLSKLADLISQFLGFAVQVVLGLIIFAIGLYLAGLASKAIQASGTAQAGLLALVARVAILVLAGAMALRQMGLANEIINLAFGLLLGAIALASALAFGLGGREVAGRELSKWVDSSRKKED